MTGRSLPEWIGATPDTAIPPRVRARVFARFTGCCQVCTRKIAAGEPWVCDHVIALANGGENAEHNLQVICGWCDRKVKTPADVAEKSAVARKRQKHLGIKTKPSRLMPGDRRGPWKAKVGGGWERRT